MNDREGRCYELSGREVIQGKWPYLIHGSVQRELDGRTCFLYHAWCENEDEVYDPVADCWRLPKVAYYILLGARVIKKYNREQACVMMLREKNWGPWHETPKEETRLRR